MQDSRTCESCGRWIDEGETLFVMTVTLQADPKLDMDAIDPETLENSRQEFEKLIEAMEKMTAGQVEEATDQVHESYQFVLCPECREEVHGRMKQRTRILGPD